MTTGSNWTQKRKPKNPIKFKINLNEEEKDAKAEFSSKLAQEEKEEGEAKDASREDKLSKLEKEGFNTKSDEEPKKDKGEDKEEKAPKKGFFSK